MFAIQWANQALTNDETVFISPNVDKVNSLYDLDHDLFGAPPEFSYFVTKTGKPQVPITVEQALKLAAVTSFTDDASSIFNPKNIFDYYQFYQSKWFDNILIKFHLSNQVQVDQIYEYMHTYAIPELGNYEGKKGNSQLRAFARLATRAITKSRDYIEEYLPFELELRYMTAYIDQSGNTYSCATVLPTISSDQEKNKNICGLWSFKNLDHMRLWYGA